MAIVQQFKQAGYKTESVELTAETLIASNYGTVWNEVDITPEDGFNERRPRRASFAPIQGVGGTTIGKLTGTFEPRPSGTDATAPDWYALAKASGASVTTDVATWGASVTTSGVLGTSATVKVRDGAYERVLAGMRCGLRFYAEKGAQWLCDVDGTGRFTESAQTAYIASSHPTTGAGQPFLGMACTIGAFSGSVASAEIAIENTVTSIEDATHSSGFGANLITGQKLIGRFTVLETGTPDWRGLYRNDATGDVVAVSLVMSSGTVGNVLTWTGNLCVTEQPKVEYRDGIGYRNIVGEFVTGSDSAALTLTQS